MTPALVDLHTLCVHAVRIVFSVAACPCLLGFHSQSQILPFNHYDTEDGLPSNDISTICQDSRGYMWFGTTDGVSVFDGYEFRNYTIADGLPLDHVLLIREDRLQPGAMWMLAGGTVVKLFNGKLTSYSLPDVTVRSFHQDRTGVVWCGTSIGLAKIRGDTLEAIDDPQFNGTIYGIVESHDSVLWLVKDGEVLRYSLVSGSKRAFRFPALVEGVFWSILGGSDGNVWVSLDSYYLVQLSDTGIVATRKFPVSTAWLCDDRHGYLWFSGYDGVGRILKSEFRSGQPLCYTKENGLIETTIRSILVDREDNLWLGGRDKGVAMLSSLHALQFPVESIWFVYQRRFAASDSRGHIWVIDNAELHEVWQEENGQWFRYAHKLPLNDGVHRSLNLGSLFFDARGRLWVTSIDTDPTFLCFEVLHSARISTKGLVGHSTLHPLRTVSVPYRTWNAWPITLIVARDGKIWSSFSRIGVVRIDPTVVPPSITIFADSVGVQSNYVRELYEDLDGNIWGATFNGGAFRISRDGSVKRYTVENGLPDNSCWALLQDPSGHMLVGTSSGGIASIAGDSIQVYSEKEGLPSNRVLSMALGPLGRLWIGTSIGVTHETAAGARQFTRQQRLLGSAANCVGVTSTGVLWFVTATDLMVHEFLRDAERSAPPLVHVRDLQVNGLPRSLDERLELPHNEGNIEIGFVGLSFRDQKAVRYRYRLVGMEETWQGPTSNVSVIYGGLHPGVYRFEVIAVSSDEIESEKPASLAITVLPPYWETVWFRGAAGLMFILLGPGLYYRRVSRLKRERTMSRNFSRQLIESQEAERKRVAGELHDGLGQELMIIINRAQMALRSPERSQAQIQEVVNTATKAIDNVREIAFDLSPYHLEQVGLAESIKSMAEKIQQLSGIGVGFTCDGPDSAVPKDIQLNVYRIVQECTSNIVKHSQATNANISLTMADSTLKIVVHDDGRGFIVPATGTNAGKGFGLSGLAERVRLLGGTMDIQSSEGFGTVVSVVIPLKPTNGGSTS